MSSHSDYLVVDNLGNGRCWLRVLVVVHGKEDGRILGGSGGNESSLLSIIKWQLCMCF